MNNQKENMTSQTWFIVLTLILIFPVGLFFMWKNDEFNKPIRVLISTFFGLALVMNIGNVESEPTAKEEPKEEVEEVEETEEAEAEDSQEGMLQYGLDHWEAEEDGIKDFIMESNKGNGLVDIAPNADDFITMVAVVSNEFRLLSQEEKEHLINDMGNGIINTISANFGHSDEDGNPQASVSFIYPDGEQVATQKMLGGWKIK